MVFGGNLFYVDHTVEHDGFLLVIVEHTDRGGISFTVAGCCFRFLNGYGGRDKFFFGHIGDISAHQAGVVSLKIIGERISVYGWRAVEPPEVAISPVLFTVNIAPAGCKTYIFAAGVAESRGEIGRQNEVFRLPPGGDRQVIGHFGFFVFGRLGHGAERQG